MTSSPAASSPSLWVAVYQPEHSVTAVKPEDWAFGLGATREAAVTALVHSCRQARWRWVHVGRLSVGEGFCGVPRHAERVLAQG